MTDISETSELTSLVERFLAASAPARVAKHPTTDEDFAAFVLRNVRALERRAILNPELLPTLIAIAQRLDEAADVVVFGTTQLNRVDKSRGLNGAEVGALLGASKQAMSKRRAIGQRRMLERAAAAGAVPISVNGRPRFSAEARREVQIVKAARQHAVTYLADFRQRKAG